MKTKQKRDEIRKVSLALDNAIESRNVEEILSNFADDCEIELLRQMLVGKEGVKKWIDWLYKNFRQVKFQPVTVIVEGNTLFEEFIVRARLYSGYEIKSKQTEVLVYNDDYKIKSLRLYFDRLDFVDLITKDRISKAIVGRVINKFLEGLS